MHYSIICSDKVFVREVATFPAKRRISICLPTLVLDFQIPFRPLEDVQELFLQTPPIFHDTVRPWHDGMGTVPHYLGNEE